MLAAVPHSFASSAKEWVIEPSPVPKLAERTIVDLQRPLLKAYPPGAHASRALRCVGFRHNRNASGSQSNCLARSTERLVAEVSQSISERRASPTHSQSTRMCGAPGCHTPVSYTHLRAHETPEHL